MTMQEICYEIILRADEDLTIEYYKNRAESHFKSALCLLLSNEETGFLTSDYPTLVQTVKLVLGENCFMPNDIQSHCDLSILRIIGAYHFSDSSNHCRGVKLTFSLVEFNDILNNKMTKTDVYSYLCYVGDKLLIFPFYEDCYISYIRSLTNNDPIFREQLDKHFSLRFLNACIDTAVIGFKREVTLQEFSR